MRRSMFLAAALLLAPAAHAVPLEFSATSFSWTQTLYSVTSTATIELVDLGDPDPDIGRLRLDISGEVITFSSPDTVAHARYASVRIFSGDAFLGLSLLSATGVLGTASGTGPDYSWVHFDLTDVPSPQALPVVPPVMDWTASWEITLDAESLGELNLWFLTGFQTCTEVAHLLYCDGIGLTTVGFPVEVSAAPIPEPGTAGLLATGLMGLGLLRRRADPHRHVTGRGPPKRSRPRGEPRSRESRW